LDTIALFLFAILAAHLIYIISLTPFFLLPSSLPSCCLLSVGVFLEMGAFDGVVESNSRFYERCLGWEGLLIEGNPTMFNRLIKENNRPTADKLHVAPTCSDDTGFVSFFLMPFTNARSAVGNTEVKGKRADVHCGPLKMYLKDLG
jgi:hypothetical protein